MNITDITKADKDARSRYTYKADPANDDNWRSHADEVLHHVAWEGDCDDLASTVLDLLDRAGMKLEDQYRLIVWATGHVGHMVACVFDDDGTPWIVGDTYVAYPYTAVNMPHIPNLYQKMTEVVPDDIWHKNVPWTLDNA